MKKLLVKLGFSKFSQEEFLEQLLIMHNDMAKKILKKKDLTIEERKKSICEIKIFFWAFGWPFLKKYLSVELFDKTTEFFFSKIAFSSIVELGYSDEYLNSFFIDRYTYHVNGVTAINEDSTANKYFQELEILFFECPLDTIEEIQEQNLMNFDFIGNFKGQVETKLMYIHLVPAYLQSLKSLIEITKK